MLAFDAMRSSGSSTQPAANHVAVQIPDVHEPTAIRNCNRLGRSANPPGFSFSDWLRDRRRRWSGLISA
jgi:hypothetical protein